MEWVALGKVADIRKGKKTEEVEYSKYATRLIMIEDLRDNSNIKYTKTDEKNIIVDEYDVVIAWDGANAGTVGFNISGAIGSTLARISSKSNSLNSQYLGNFLRSKSDEIRANCTGATVPHVSRNHLNKLQIPVPSLETQEKIVKTLDMARALIEKRKEQLVLLDELITSIFYTMFGDPVRNEKGWEVRALGEVAINNIKKISKEFKGNISYIDIGSINREDHSITGYSNYMIKDAPSRAKKILNHGDILFSTVRPNLKNIALFNIDTPEKAVGSTGFYVIRVNRNLANTLYIFHSIKSDSFTNDLIKVAKGASYPAVKDKDISSKKIAIPPLTLQNEFAEKVEMIEKEKELLRASLALLEENYQSIMSKAFQGELFN